MRLLHDPEALHDAYVNAAPFPHAVIDGLFDEAYLEQVLSQFPRADEPVWESFEDGNEAKLGYHYERHLRFEVQAFLFLMNSHIALNFIEHLTGICGLIPDPYFGGGGPHLVPRGGFLKVHTDFNMHPSLHLDRRVNVLVYLNRDWDESWGGHLELWNAGLTERVQRIAPIFNRTVVFNTTETSWHGHPHPLECPDGVARKSISFYYYTAPKPGDPERAPTHATVFRDVH